MNPALPDCRISHPGLIDLRCGGCKKGAESKVKHTVTNSATQGRRNWGHKGRRGRVGNSMFDFSLFFLLAVYTLQIDESLMTNFPPNFQTFLLPFDTATML